jgi:hypothetical protein
MEKETDLRWREDRLKREEGTGVIWRVRLEMEEETGLTWIRRQDRDGRDRPEMEEDAGL